MNLRRIKLTIGDTVKIKEPICKLEEFSRGTITEIKEAKGLTWFLVTFSKDNPINCWYIRSLLQYESEKKPRSTHKRAYKENRTPKGVVKETKT